MANSKHLIAILILTILASGCVDGNRGEETSETFIEVNEFEAVPNPIPSGREANINLEAENPGDEDIDNAAAKIFGPAFINSKPETEQMTDIQGGLPASTENTVAQPRRANWNIQTPEIGQNREADYKVYSEIYYDYTTRADTEFDLVSYDRLNEQEYTQTDATMSNNDAPIEIDIRGTTPKVFYEEGQGENVGESESTIDIIVRNTGSGDAFINGNIGSSDPLANAEMDTVKLQIDQVNGVTFRDTDGNVLSPGDEIEVDLLNGKEGYETITMDAGNIQNPELSVDLRVTANYGYVEETSTTMTVEGRRN